MLNLHIVAIDQETDRPLLLRECYVLGLFLANAVFFKALHFIGDLVLDLMPIFAR